MSLLHPRHVTPFVMGPHKSDERDAFAITLAAGCPEIPRIVAKERTHPARTTDGSIYF